MRDAIVAEPARHPAILIVGCGRMGSAFARGWQGDYALFALDPGGQPPDFVTRLADPSAIVGLPRPLIVLLAVKPTMLPGIAADLRAWMTGDVVVLSIMAGLSTATIAAALGPNLPIIRAMPNTAVAVKAGVTAAFAAAGVSDTQRTACDRLLAAVGTVAWLDDESLLDAATAISGSGPAYFFRFAEVLASAGEALGLTPDTAALLSRGTLAGAGALVVATPETLARLREDVTSPGGTTATALAALDHDAALATLIDTAARAARDRAIELGTRG